MAVRSSHPLLASLQTIERGKIVTPTEAVRLIRDGDTIATAGFVGIGFAEGIAVALEELYQANAESDLQATGRPRDLTLVYAAGQGAGRARGRPVACRSDSALAR